MDSHMSGAYHGISWGGPLSSVQQTLYNGHRMVCVNCVPSNQNITVQTETRSSMTPQLYARDVAVTAVICFIGGVGLTLLVVLIYYKVCRKKKLKESKRQKEEEEGSGTIANHRVNHLDASEKRKDFFLQENSSQSGDREAVALDTRTYGHGGPFRSRAVENLFRCPDCGTEGQKGMGLNSIRGNIRINGGMEAEEEIAKRRMRMMAEEERWRLGKLSRDISNELLSRSNTNASPHPWKETFSERPETLAAYKTNRKMGEKTDTEGKSRGHETFHCESCHRTYRPPEQNMTQARIHTNTGDSARFDGFPSQYRQIDRGGNVNHNQFDMLTNTERRRETRNVTFDLESPRALEQRKSQDEEGGRGKSEEKERADRDKERGRVRRHKAKAQASRLLKVKLNLNPLGKSKVHPRRKTEEGRSEKSSSKKGRDKKQDGKERQEKEGKSGKKTKGSSEKVKKSTTKGLTEDGEEEKEEEDRGGAQKSKMSPEQQKTTSKSGQRSQGSTEGDQGENTNPENSQTGSKTNTADQSASAIAAELGQILQGGSIQYQGAGLVLGSAQLSSQHPLSLSTADRNRTTNRSLLGSVGSQLTGSLLSAAQGSNPLLAGYPANSVAPRIAISGPNMAPGGAPDSFSRQAGVGLASPATSLLANAVHANPLQASATHTSPLHAAQLAGLASVLAANPGVPPAQSLLQSQPAPGSSSLVTKFDPAQAIGLQTGDVLQLLSESQAPGTNESLTFSTQEPSSVDGLFGVTPQAPGPMTTAENLPNNNSQTEMGLVPAGTTVNASAGGVALTEGLSAGGSMQAADVTVSGVSAHSMATQSVSSTGEAAAALLQQEYLSEEGGSSPRRKLRLVIPEKVSSRPPTALERKIR